MDNPSFFSGLPRHKRKSDDSDAVIDLLHDVCISPRSKKARQEFGSENHFNEFVSNFSGNVPVPEVELPDSASGDVAMAPLATLNSDLSGGSSECALPASLNSERAIVLYKPVTPPLFPGGPISGSQVLVNARILPEGMLDAPTVFSRREDEFPWFSAPKNSMDIMELLEHEKNNPASVHYNHLAVVPWDSKSPVNLLMSQTASHPSNVSMVGMSGDDQTSSVEAMEEEDESNVKAANTQSSHAMMDFFNEPWQQYGAPQSQFGSPMWSH